ncbi:hypothetical protein BCAR13_390036 [Paraburkholderia caribensis]|nr:hypothetical protein BCAR13_390036 [Paraburkholderia caribensis]
MPRVMQKRSPAAILGALHGAGGSRQAARAHHNAKQTRGDNPSRKPSTCAVVSLVC